MANTIALAEKYSPILDEIYKRESVSAVLDTPGDLVQWVGANTARIFKTELDGLADYDRNGGYVDGSINAGWETYTLAFDRGRMLNCDSMDNEESMGMAFGTLAGEFVRVKEIPEIDAYTFAKIAGTTGIQTATPADLSSVTDLIAEVDKAQAALDNAEVPFEGRLLFVSPDAYQALKGKISRYLANETTVDRNIYMLDNMRVLTVPQPRFNTAIDLLSGGTGEEAGGFAPASGSYKINFMLLHPSAVMKVLKHRVPKIISPELNQSADGWKFGIRVYGDTFVKDNKVSGIYLHNGSTAN